MPQPLGPWRAEEVATNCIEVKDSEDRCVASIICDADDLNDDDREITRLISAAPDLLTALRRIDTGARRYLDHPTHERDYESMRAIIEVCADLARAALAKARP